MKWKQVQKLSFDAFRRLTGVKRATFEQMVDWLWEALVRKRVLRSPE